MFLMTNKFFKLPRMNFWTLKIFSLSIEIKAVSFVRRKLFLLLFSTETAFHHAITTRLSWFACKLLPKFSSFFLIFKNTRPFFMTSMQYLQLAEAWKSIWKKYLDYENRIGVLRLHHSKIFFLQSSVVCSKMLPNFSLLLSNILNSILLLSEKISRRKFETGDCFSKRVKVKWVVELPHKGGCGNN